MKHRKQGDERGKVHDRTSIYLIDADAGISETGFSGIFIYLCMRHLTIEINYDHMNFPYPKLEGKP